ncbi:MAG: hypothetical protein IJZ55_07205 [Lachnospiraceae bacterium]|nr:hypothetical protein [Lachnospiraceae bacterium]
MEQNNKAERFQYSYSAKQQEEIKNIRSKYEEPKEDKMAYLRRLDESATKKGTLLSIVVGVIGTLILGLGMCCVMVWQTTWFVPGILIGLLGIVVVAIAYPVYLQVTKKEREKIAPEVLRLTDELLK